MPGEPQRARACSDLQTHALSCLIVVLLQIFGASAAKGQPSDPLTHCHNTTLTYPRIVLQRLVGTSQCHVVT